MTEREAYIAFSACPGIGPQRFKLIHEYFGSARSAWLANKDIYLRLGLGEKLTEKFLIFRTKFDPGGYETDLLEKEIKVVTRIDREYPPKLSQIPDPPIALYLKGNLPKESLFIAVVGTRKPTIYGRQVTEQLSHELVSSGFVIVSGLARGIDGIAHQVALDDKAETIAVLGCGVDIIYPPEHRDLYADIIENKGAIISEVPPGHTVNKGLFPARNRIISGLSLGVVVTEGAQDSGSLITARYAAEQGREVFAVPGPITSYLSAGPTKLIKQGAKLVSQVEDILEELNLKSVKKNVKEINKISKRELTQEEAKIIDLLSTGEKHYDEIIRESELAVTEVGILITQLELSGIIRALGNGKYGLKEA